MASISRCQCGPADAAGPLAGQVKCLRCGQPPAPQESPPREQPFDLLGKLVANHQGSGPPRRPWLLRFGAGSAVGLFMMAAAVVWFVGGKPTPSNPAPQDALAQTVTPQAQPSQAEWQRFQPPVGGASVTFPGAPRELPKPPLKNETRLFTYASPSGTAYTFGITRLPPEAAGFSDYERLVIIRDGLLSGRESRGHKGKTVFNRRFQFEGREAMESKLAISDDSMFRYFLFVRDEYYYVLTVAGTEEAVSTPDAERFLTSFR